MLINCSQYRRAPY